jgi:RalA-binding protein 1
MAEKPLGPNAPQQLFGASVPLPAPPMANHAGDRGFPRNIPRTSSIDSAISSISSASNSHRPPLDPTNLTAADINNLIAAAGSPEAVIIHLLKEKHHAATQNVQLWRLVDKQRALVLGLNKDLERAVKDKERYRKKLKELQGQSSSVASTGAPAGDHAPPSSSPVEPIENDDRSAADSSLQGAQLQNSPPLHPPLQPLRSLANASAPVASREAPALDSNSPPSRPPVALRVDETRSEISDSSAGSPAQSPLSQRSPGQKIPPPNRKPPPAPLNLRPIQHRPSPAHPTALEDGTDSDYDDILGEDEIEEDRGRRRTREDDDREREAAVIREQEARSRSMKQSANPIAQAPEQLNASVTRPDPTLPQPNSRKVVAQSPPHLSPGTFIAAVSLGSVMSANVPADSSALGALQGVSPPPMSPGLPVSPRPADRPLGSPLPRRPREGSGAAIVSPPLTPRPVPPALPLGPPGPLTQRAPLSPQTPALSGPKNVTSTVPIPSIDASVTIDSPTTPREKERSIYQGLASEEYPGLLLPPNALPSIAVKVASSRLRPSRHSFLGLKAADEEPVFTLSVFARAANSELWRVEKVILTLPQLDHQVRQLCDFPAKLPDRSIFSGHSPAKVDARRAALNDYFEALLDTELNDTAARVICRFLSEDAIEPRDDETDLLKANGKSIPEVVRGPDGKPRKEGYLTKRGKNFGGWKSRYFVLHGPEFRYFEAPGGAHLGTIKLLNAQIGKQSQHGHTTQSPSRNDDDSDNQYRHAFLILEPKKKDSTSLVRHVLCAESDEERDAWVDALLQYVDPSSSDEERAGIAARNPTSNSSQVQTQHQPPSTKKPKLFTGGATKKPGKGADSPDLESDGVQGFSYDDAVAAEPPIRRHSPYEKDPTRPPTARSGSVGELPQAARPGEVGPNVSKTISGPTNGAIIQDVGAWGNKPMTSNKEKKRSIWFLGRSSSDLASHLQGSGDVPVDSHVLNSFNDRRELIRPVFGMPLAEAVQYCPPRGLDLELPAVVYRCIEYLNVKDAALEEGIFRLSGSNVVIRALKERFNTEGDVNILAGDQYYDVHAVASLFKQYLRELPTTVLTRELHLDFLKVLGSYSHPDYSHQPSRSEY